MSGTPAVLEPQAGTAAAEDNKALPHGQHPAAAVKATDGAASVGHTSGSNTKNVNVLPCLPGGSAVV